MDKRNNDFDFDFTPIGQAIKKARKAKGVSHVHGCIFTENMPAGRAV